MNTTTRKMPSSVPRSNRNSLAIAAATSANPAPIGSDRCVLRQARRVNEQPGGHGDPADRRGHVTGEEATARSADQYACGHGERRHGVDDAPRPNRPPHRPSPSPPFHDRAIATAQATSSRLDTSVETASGAFIAVAWTNELGGA